jgi:putative peptide-modifying radical SAM enzyme
MRADLVERITKEAPVRRFMLHTNGLLLDRLPFDVLERIDTISVSVDGDEEQTDDHRGHGTFRKVMENLCWLMRKGYRGEVIARMTVPIGADIERGVSYLSENSEYRFDSIHWQLDAGFATGVDIGRFREWIDHSYNPGIRLLVRRWVKRIAEECRGPRWYPFIATMHDLLEGRPSRLRCGCGHESYSIMTGGAITPCPIMVGLKSMYLGHISTTDPSSLPRMEARGVCRTCNIHDFCGGRCLYAHIMALWSEEERGIICGTVEHLRRCMLEEMPRLRRLIDGGLLCLQDLDFQRYNGCEIIP